MSSLAKSGQIQKAEEILNRMENYHSNGRMDLSPNTISYNTLIDAYAKARNPLKAEEVLRRMMTLSQNDIESNVKAGMPRYFSPLNVLYSFSFQTLIFSIP